ncbi:hypothetical protein F0562_005345 [Nyssa sinensis]|uniref:Uncharacterized protein n=1 Tax=Nyssa sinensis TaxID=561372 RepID=A0A5J5ANS0_9ASTE|nr:hypothetical protein F0562_005345 [Nyssa sinensis]
MGETADEILLIHLALEILDPEGVDLVGASGLCSGSKSNSVSSFVYPVLILTYAGEATVAEQGKRLVKAAWAALKQKRKKENEKEKAKQQKKKGRKQRLEIKNEKRGEVRVGKKKKVGVRQKEKKRKKKTVAWKLDEEKKRKQGNSGLETEKQEAEKKQTLR